MSINASEKEPHHPWEALNQFVAANCEQGKFGKLTLILGAGIHNLHEASNWQENEARKRLSSWNALLEKLGSDNTSMLSPTLGWEFLSIDKCTHTEDQANKRENQLRCEDGGDKCYAGGVNGAIDISERGDYGYWKVFCEIKSVTFKSEKHRG